MYKTRQKRDTVENIYRQCQITGQCPPDVVNKVEQTTLADYLLKIFGSIIYLGGLGIGSGAGGAASVRPIPDNIPLEPTIPELPIPEEPGLQTPAVRPNRPFRPTTFGTRIDPISSAANRPRPINPTGPAIVPLSEGGLPDPTIISTGAGPGTGLGDFEVFTNTDLFEDINTVTGHPTVLHGQEDIAILDITPEQAPPHRIAFEYPSTDGSVTIIESSTPSPADLNIYVDPNYAGIHVGEEIELEPINTIQEFEIEDISPPKTSTPSQIFERTVGRAKQLYTRYVEQAPTRNVEFLGQPSRAILFEYENPAFSDDITLNFERDLQEVAAAPDPTFTDVIQLHRPQFSETNQGLIRYSRLGTRGKISTRSGAILRQKVHFFYDFSPISAVSDTIELELLDDASDAVTIVDELSRSTFINPVFEDVLGEDTILDNLEETFQNSHLALLNETEEEQVLIPTLVTDITSSNIAIDDIGSAVFVGYKELPNIILPTNTQNTIPAIQIDALGSDYYLHPSMLKRRKRKYSETF